MHDVVAETRVVVELAAAAIVLMAESEKKMKIIGKVPRVDGRELSYRRFWEQFMQANKPVLLTGLMDSWAACRDWVLLDGKPNLSFIAEHFGSSLVQVLACFSFSPFLPLSHRFPSQSESSKLFFLDLFVEKIRLSLDQTFSILFFRV